MVPSVLRAGLSHALYGTLHRLPRTVRGLAAWLRQMMLPVPLMFVLMVAASASTISAFAAVYEAHRSQEAAGEAAQNLARQLALTADDRLASASIDLLQRDLAAAAAGNPRVIEVAVLDSGGHLLARAIRPNLKQTGKILTAASPTVAGSVRVTEQAPDSEALSGFVVALVALNALVLALAVVVATRLGRRAYQPVRRFTEVVTALTADRFNLDSPRLGDRLLQPALDHLWTMGRSVTTRERELAAQNTLWQRRYGQARALIDLMAEFNQVMVLRPVLERLSLGLSRFFAGDAVAIWIFSAPRGDLGLAAEVAGTFPRRLSGSDQWVRQVLTAGAPAVRCPWIQEAFPWMAAPLLDAQGRTIGLVMLTSSRRTEYSSEEHAFLRTVIAHAAMAIQNAAAYEQTDALSRTDALTGLHNRREFDRVLGQELGRARQTAQPLALLMVDIDYFKRINDERGHQAGDVALQQLARLIQQVPARANDAAFRFGGEEFAIVLTQTDKASALTKAETLRRVTEESAFLDTGSQLTVSVGVANFPDDGMELAQLVTCADRALYQAKNAGRNRVQAA